MKGEHKILIYSKRIKFEFTVRRNITILKGDSATGKTTLVNIDGKALYIHRADLSIWETKISKTKGEINKS